MLLVHSAVCDEDITLKRFADSGLQAEILARSRVVFGPVMRARAAMLEARGLIEPRTASRGVGGHRSSQRALIRSDVGSRACIVAGGTAPKGGRDGRADDR